MIFFKTQVSTHKFVLLYFGLSGRNTTMLWQVIDILYFKTNSSFRCGLAFLYEFNHYFIYLHWFTLISIIYNVLEKNKRNSLDINFMTWINSIMVSTQTIGLKVCRGSVFKTRQPTDLVSPGWKIQFRWFQTKIETTTKARDSISQMPLNRCKNGQQGETQVGQRQVQSAINIGKR